MPSCRVRRSIRRTRRSMSCSSASVQPTGRFTQPGAADHAPHLQQLLDHGRADDQLLLMAHQRQVGVEDILGVVTLAGLEEFLQLDQRLGVGKCAEGAIHRAVECLREMQPVVALEEGQAAHTLGLGVAQRLGLVQTRAQALAHAHQTLEVLQHADEQVRGDGDAGDGRLVVQDPGDLTQPLADALEIVVDVLVGAQRHIRADAHAGCACIHHPPAQQRQVVDARRGDVDDGRDAAVQVPDAGTDHRKALVVGELVGLGAGPQQQHATCTAGDQEVHLGPDAIQIQGPVVGER